jgi:hypothetical protein
MAMRGREIRRGLAQAIDVLQFVSPESILYRTLEICLHDRASRCCILETTRTAEAL